MIRHTKKDKKVDSLQDLPPRNIEKTLETFDESTDSEVDPTPFISIDKIPKEKRRVIVLEATVTREQMDNTK